MRLVRLLVCDCVCARAHGVKMCDGRCRSTAGSRSPGTHLLSLYTFAVSEVEESIQDSTQASRPGVAQGSTIYSEEFEGATQSQVQTASVVTDATGAHRATRRPSGVGRSVCMLRACSGSFKSGGSSG